MVKYTYEERKLTSRADDLIVKSPTDKRSVAVLEILTREYSIDTIGRSVDEIKKQGVTSLVIDITRFPKVALITNAAFLFGAFEMGGRLKTRYVGINKEELEKYDERSFEHLLNQRTYNTIDEAVESL